MGHDLSDKHILLIITGGIAAYKSLELIRLLKKQGAAVRCILTDAAKQFVTPLSVASLTEAQVYDNLWSLKDETEMGHIRLSREADLIVIAPASANIIAKMAHGIADDLATTTLLASNKTALIAPAMNHKMWSHPATQNNLQILASYGIQVIEPTEGDMACGEHGMGRMAEPENISRAITAFFFDRPLKGLKALVTAGPTYEPIDPVRFIGNRSSGKQGFAIAESLRKAGADVTCITGPTHLHTPPGVRRIDCETAKHMHDAVINTLPVDIAVCTAAVSDWSPKIQKEQKIKKRAYQSPPTIELTENPDILAALAKHKKRPKLVIGFAAETENLIENAQAKLEKKRCDWIIANNVGQSAERVFGTDKNRVTFVTATATEEWPLMAKQDVAKKIVRKITKHFEK